MPIEIRPTAVICSIRLVRFSAERKRSFWSWKITQITARPRTTRSEARSPWTKRRRLSLLIAFTAGARDRGDDMLLRRLLGLEVAGCLAQPQDDDPVGDLEDVRQVVADHDHAETALAQATDQLEHLLG